MNETKNPVAHTALEEERPKESGAFKKALGIFAALVVVGAGCYAFGRFSATGSFTDGAIGD